MKRYIGIDAHAETCTIAVVSSSGRRLGCQVVETSGKALIGAIKGIAGEKHVCIEEGTQSAWLYELLGPRVEEVVVTVPEEARGCKDDRRDAFARAEELRVGAIRKRVYKAPLKLGALRAAMKGHLFSVQDLARAKNRLRSVFRSRGVSVDASVYEESGRERWLRKLPEPHRQLAEVLGKRVDVLKPLQKDAERWLRAESRSHPIIKVLSTAPGMGWIRSAQVVAVVGSPERFRTRQQFWSYSGLGVEMRSSSNWTRDAGGRLVRSKTVATLGLNKGCHRLLKAVFKGAAVSVIAQHPGDPLHAGYEAMLGRGLAPNLARVTLARQIAATTLSMWKHGEVYDPARRVRTDKEQQA